MPCPHCKAVYTNDETCEDRFNTSQLMELEQPEYYAAHHMSVPSFMLQHNAYSAKGWLVACDLLQRFVYAGLTPQEFRQQLKTSVDSGQRGWSITRGPKLSGIEKIVWSMTIADIRLDTEEHYCADIRAWAESILKSSEKICSV